jgi:hypothetical protein
LEKYGLLGFQQRYAMQMAALKREKEQGLIGAEAYAKAEKMLKIQFWKEAFDYYSNLFSGAVSALQNAEIANMEPNMTPRSPRHRETRRRSNAWKRRRRRRSWRSRRNTPTCSLP